MALSGVDGPLAALLSDAESLKLLHGCSNDAVWLATNLDVAVLPPILDTQEAARCCSMPTTAVSPCPRAQHPLTNTGGGAAGRRGYN